MAELLMPKLGLTMTEGLLLEWVVKPGDNFSTGDILFVVETEKVANEVEAQADGLMTEILIEEGETIAVGVPVALVESEGYTSHSEADSPGDVAPANASAPAPEPVPGEKLAGSKAASASATSNRVIATPLARRIAKDEAVDLHSIKGSGSRGRIKADDVRTAAAQSNAAPAATADQALTAAGVQIIEPDAARRNTAQHVTVAKQTIPHFYLSTQAEMSTLQQLRQQLNSDSSASKVSVTHLLVKAIGMALNDMPETNRIWSNDKILAFDRADIGMVVETENGVRIPVIRNVGNAPLDAVVSQANSLIKRSKENKLTPQDVGDCSIAISNVGMFGATSLIPIINAPNAIMVGVGAEQSVFRPDENGNPTVRKELTLWLACDHRVLDGADAARFLSHLVTLLENPLRLLRSSQI